MRRNRCEAYFKQEESWHCDRSIAVHGCRSCYSNIYDFLGNCHEWTTEYGKSNPCVGRGGNWEDRDYGASDRIAYMLNISTGDGSFRIQLYIK